MVIDFQVGDLALERAGLLEREDEGANVVHGVLATVEVTFLDVHRLDELAIDEKRSGAIVPLHLHVQLLTRIRTELEGVQIAIACKAKTSANGVGQVKDGIVRTEQLGTGSLVSSLEVEADGIAVAYIIVGVRYVPVG